MDSQDLQDDLNHLRQLKRQYKINVQELEKQAAYHGLDVPLHIANGIRMFTGIIDELTDKISKLEQEIENHNSTNSHNRRNHRIDNYRNYNDTNRGEYTPILLKSLPEGKSILVDLSQYDSLEALLDDIFIYYLSDIVPPYTYGSEWILTGLHGMGQIIVPLEWMINQGTPIHQLDIRWAPSIRPDSSYIEAGSPLHVVYKENFKDLTNRGLQGIVTNNKKLAEVITGSAKVIYMMLQSNYLVECEDNIDISNYKYKRVFPVLFSRYNTKNIILKESGQEIDPDYRDFFVRRGLIE